MVWPWTSAKSARANQQLPAMHWWFAAAPPWWGRWNCAEIERKSSDVGCSWCSLKWEEKASKMLIEWDILGIYWVFLTGWYLGNGWKWDILGSTPKVWRRAQDGQQTLLTVGDYDSPRNLRFLLKESPGRVGLLGFPWARAYGNHGGRGVYMISLSQQSDGFKQRKWWEKHQNAGCSKQQWPSSKK